MPKINDVETPHGSTVHVPLGTEVLVVPGDRAQVVSAPVENGVSGFPRRGGRIIGQSSGYVFPLSVGDGKPKPTLGFLEYTRTSFEADAVGHFKPALPGEYKLAIQGGKTERGDVTIIVDPA